MVKIHNRIEHASQHFINAKSTLVIKTLSCCKKIPVKKQGVIEIDYKESFWQSNGLDTIPKVLLEIMV